MITFHSGKKPLLYIFKSLRYFGINNDLLDN